MNKHLLLLCMLVVSSMGFILAEEVEEAAAEETVLMQKADEDANLVELLKFLDTHEIPVPEVKAPSTLMIWLRSFGIAFLYKYYALKNWLSGKADEA